MSQGSEFVTGWLLVLFGCVVRHIAFDLSSHQGESILNVKAVLSGGLQVADIIELCLFFSLFLGDLSFLFKVALVSDQDS